MKLEILIGLTISGLTVGMVYALIALGYSMVYGVLKIINFAHGEVFTVGGLLGTTFLLMTLGEGDKNIAFRIAFVLLAFFFSIILTAGLGWTLERLAYRPLRKASRIAPLLSAIGASIFLQNLLMLVYGSDPIEVPDSAIVSGYLTIMGANVRYLALLIIAVAVLLMLALTIFIKKSFLGKAMRATSQDREAAEMMGINTNLTISMTFIIGSSLAAVAGILVAMYYGTIRFDTGFLYGIKAFTAAVLGGIGNIPGAVLGSLVLGLAENYGVGLTFGMLGYVMMAVLVIGLVYQYWILPSRVPAHKPEEIGEVELADGGTDRNSRIRKIYYGGWATGLRTYVTEGRDADLRVHGLRATRIGAFNTILLLYILVATTFLSDYQISTQWKDATAFLVLMVVLIFKPSGLLGERIPEKV